VLEMHTGAWAEVGAKGSRAEDGPHETLAGLL
jgi:hypothetical protein